jgi:hypothetical protein
MTHELWKRRHARGHDMVRDIIRSATPDAQPADRRRRLQRRRRDRDELWRSNGTEGHDAREGHQSVRLFPNALVEVDDIVYFRADDGTRPRSDGTDEGTTSPRQPRAAPCPRTRNVKAGSSYADDGVRGDELWMTDGTPDAPS